MQSDPSKNKSKNIKTVRSLYSFKTLKLSTLALAIRASIITLGLASGTSQAATIEVNTNADDANTSGNCSLREAIVSINNSNSGSPALEDNCNNTGAAFGTNDTIVFSNALVSNTIVLANGELNIATGRDLSIDASNIIDGITVDADQQSRVFKAYFTTLAIDNMTLTNGSAFVGGGINAYGSNISLVNTTVSQNYADFDGGGILASSSNISLSNVTISENSASYGGGINMTNGTVGTINTMSLTNSTVSGNSANNGGGVYGNFSVIISLYNTTVSNNSADSGGAGIRAIQSSSISLSNSIVANSKGSTDCFASSATITSDSASIIEDGSCGSPARTGDAGLFPLADNGGVTQTHAIKANSIARDSGIGSLITDQRGRPRTDGALDVGAFELATIEVTTNSDANNGCTLREAISSINVGSAQNGCELSEGDLTTNASIVFASTLSGDTITLAGSQLTVNEDRNATIDASSLNDSITLDADQNSRIFYAKSATLAIDNMILNNGTGINGGGIYAVTSNVSLSHSLISNNSADVFGGGVLALNQTTLVLSNSIVSENYAVFGGGVGASTFADISIDSTTLSENSASTGGGIGVAGATKIALNNTTISANTVTSKGGGLYVSGNSNATFSNTTLSGNSATNNGGGISLTVSTASLNNVTIAENQALIGGGVSAENSSYLSLSNSIIANSILATDCVSLTSSTVVSDSASIIEDDDCATNARNIDPGIEPLTDNSGPTQTHALTEVSPARNAGIVSAANSPFENCTNDDQRGEIRGSRCDIGAFEYIDDGGFFVIPIGNGKSVVIPL